jgi:chloride channel protein, CIC family
MLHMEPQPSTYKRLYAATRQYISRHWEKALRVREQLSLSEESLHLLIASGVGVIGGVINVLFYLSVEKIQVLIVGSDKNIVEVARSMNAFWRFVTPAIGGLVAGSVLFWGLRLAGKARTTNILEVVVAGDGRLPFRSGLVRAVSSLMSIGSGASIGREGGITQLSATAASKWGQIANWQPYRLRLLVACGAAAGMAAAYNAPITGAIFAAHIVLGNFSMNLFAPLLCSSVVATMVSRSFFGIKQWYEVPSFDFTSMWQLPWFLVLGFMAGVMGSSFLKLLRFSQEAFQRMPKSFGPMPGLPVRMALAGLVVGTIAQLYPEVWGNGYGFTSEFIQKPHEYGAQMLLGILMAKLVATAITVGSGAVGGVITPTLFFGASLGGLFGLTLDKMGLAPAHLPVGTFALVGMGSVFAATTRSPLLAIVMIFEISLNYSLMPALMIGCAVSTLVSQRLHPNSIYTEPIKLRSLEVESYRLGAATQQTIGDLMRTPVPPVRENTTLPQIAERFLSSQNNFIPVVDAQMHLLGIVALQDLKEYLGAGQELNAIIAGDVMRPIPPCLRPGQRLMDALPTLLASEQRNVPVVNNFDDKRLIGSVPRAEALAALSEAIAASTATTSSTEVIAKDTQASPKPLPTTK